MPFSKFGDLLTLYKELYEKYHVHTFANNITTHNPLQTYIVHKCF
jgi:hypothetical protein